MTTRKKIAIFSLMAVVLGGFVVFVPPRSEPGYQGKSLSRWIRGLEYENVNPSEEQRAFIWQLEFW